MDLLRELIRARALEQILGRVRTGDPSPFRPVSPALPAARALHAAADGSGDVFSFRQGSPAATLALGVSPRELLRQAAGRASAPAAGRDPGGVPTDLERGLVGPVRVPGVLLQVLAGVALSFRLRGESRVALLLDDLPGTDAGDWHEGLSVAATRRVPLVLVIQGRGPVPDPGETRVADPSDARAPGRPPAVPMEERAPGYGVQLHPVAGQDPRAVEKVTWQAVEAARNGRGPQVVEVAPPARDPVEWLAETLVAAGSEEAGAVEELRREAEEEMSAAWREVEEEPLPPPEAVAAGHPGVPRGAWCRWEGAA